MKKKKHKKGNVKDEYKSSNLILEYMYKEYCRENERRKNIESRITILMTIATFFCGLILTNDKVDFRSMLINGEPKIYLCIGLQIMSCVSVVISIGLFTSILVSRGYRSIKTEGFMKQEPQNADNGLVAYDLIKAYNECLIFNKKINDKKFKINNLGIYLLIISIILYLLLRVSYIII